METLIAVLIIRLFTGVVHLGDDGAWKPGLTVIRTQADYDRFVSRIPTTKLQKRQPAPPSQDPLLKKPAIDFKKHMLLVVTTDFILTNVKIDAVERGSEVMVVRATCTTPPDARQQAHPLFYGRYAAAEVDRFDGEVILNTEK